MSASQVPFIDVSLLKPGDCLVYRASSFLGAWIAFKTWTNASHVAGYDGEGWSVEANEHGVNRYPVRVDKYLSHILRPTQPFYHDEAKRWFDVPYDPKTHLGIKGQGYDIKGLFVFYWAARHGSPDKMFCSEFLTRWYRQGGFDPVAADMDADRVSPAQFLQSPMFTKVWTAKNG